MNKSAVKLIILFVISSFFTYKICEGAEFSDNFLEAVNVRSGWGDAPDFSTIALDGRSFTLSSLRGKVILLNFWATWCPPCRGEIPDLIQLNNDYKTAGLAMVGVSLDNKPSVVREFVKKKRINYTILPITKNISAKYNDIVGIPTTFIIDKNGYIVKKYVGAVEKEILEKEIIRLLNK